MDYETKIYLDKLIEAIEELNSPDWWTIILTIINIGAFVFVAVTQIRLQRQQNIVQQQQTKLLEYDIYKQLYSVIKDVNRLADVLLMHIYEHFSNGTLRNINFSILNRLYDDIVKLDERLSNNSLDFELKLNGDLNDLGAYQQLIFQMRLLALRMKEMESNKQIVFKEGADENPILLEHRGEKNALISAIIERVADEHKETTKHLIDSYLLVKNQVMDFNTLEKIKDRITPNDKK